MIGKVHPPAVPALGWIHIQAVGTLNCHLHLSVEKVPGEGLTGKLPLPSSLYIIMCLDNMDTKAKCLHLKMDL
jgi:hypothetical protein